MDSSHFVVKAIVTVKETEASFFTTILTAPFDCLTDLFGRTFLLQLHSSLLDTCKLYSSPLNSKS